MHKHVQDWELDQQRMEQSKVTPSQESVGRIALGDQPGGMGEAEQGTPHRRPLNHYQIEREMESLLHRLSRLKELQEGLSLTGDKLTAASVIRTQKLARDLGFDV